MENEREREREKRAKQGGGRKENDGEKGKGEMNSQSREKCTSSRGLCATVVRVTGKQKAALVNSETYHLNAIHELLKLINLG